MGAESSKGSDSTNYYFTSAGERNQLEAIWRQIGDEKLKVVPDKLQLFLHDRLPVDAVSHLYQYAGTLPKGHSASPKKAVANVTCEDFTVCIGHMLKGTKEQLACILLRLSVSDRPDDIKKLLDVLLRLCVDGFRDDKAFQTWRFSQEYSKEALIKSLISELSNKGTTDQQLSVDDIEQWLQRSTLLLQIVHLAFYRCFPIRILDKEHEGHSLLPIYRYSSNAPQSRTILDLTSVLFLNNAIPHEYRTEWRLLFNSQSQGESFATMLRSIVDCGPTVLVVKDKDGNVFGGFAADSWSLQARFYGSSHCFLFSIMPTMDVYLPSGYNTNFMYLNHNQQTLPNGLGMGGQFGYFGLWLDHEYGCGHSQAQPKCTTFNSPQLSSSAQFNIDTVEVWAVGPEKVTTEESESKETKKKTGILNMDIETKAILAALDKGHHSEALREADDKLAADEANLGKTQKQRVTSST